MIVKSIYRLLYKKIVGNMNPIRYARKIGVNMNGKVYLTGGVIW